MKESDENNRIPAILATAKGQEYDRVRSLDLGTDDYLVKPFSMMEMVSRVKAVLRRSQPQQVCKLMKVDGLVVNLDAYTVIADGCRVQLAYKEFELLRMFLSHPGMVYIRESGKTGACHVVQAPARIFVRGYIFSLWNEGMKSLQWWHNIFEGIPMKRNDSFFRSVCNLAVPVAQ